MKITRIDAAPNLDIQTGPDDEIARRGHMAARAADAAMKEIMRADAEESKEEKEKKDAAAKADADAGEKLDKILECLDSLGKRMDAYDAQMDAAKRDGAEAAQIMTDKKKKDAEGEMEEKGKPEELKADKKSDAYSDADRRDALSQIQTDADRASSAWGEKARTPWTNEDPQSYLRRAALPHKRYSSAWADVDLNELSGKALRNAADQIFSDSIAASCANETYAGGDLREVRKVNRDTGHVIKEYYGSPMAWMQQFAPPRQRARFDMETIKKSMSKGWNK